MKYEGDWALQGSSCKRLEYEAHERCQVAFEGVHLASIERIPLCARNIIKEFMPCSN